MDISLRKIDQTNYEIVCDLDVSNEQQDYVACNMWSLVEANYNSGFTCRAIYEGQQAVGFLMWVLETDSKISIWRFMVDHQHQNRGIGRQALTLAIAEIKATSGITEIEICYDPKNPVAKDYYASFGFMEVGMDEDEEDMLARIVL